MVKVDGEGCVVCVLVTIAVKLIALKCFISINKFKSKTVDSIIDWDNFKYNFYDTRMLVLKSRVHCLILDSRFLICWPRLCIYMCVFLGGSPVCHQNVKSQGKHKL